MRHEDLEHEIGREARRLVLRHERHARRRSEEAMRRGRRSKDPEPVGPMGTPEAWQVAPGFQPYTVLRRQSAIAHSISRALNDRRYEPRTPVVMERDKPGSDDKRLVSMYQVADSAISKWLFERLMSKNLSLMSARSYAYRPDIGAQDAVSVIKRAMKTDGRLYIAEYDFRRYFDTIRHDYLLDTLLERFYVTHEERSAIKGFLQVGGLAKAAYRETGAPSRRRGIPHGTSISLFLANVAASPIDAELEQCGVGFVRYADDTFIWSRDYGQICAAAEILHAHAPRMGVRINHGKSPGIRLLVPHGTRNAEMPMTAEIEYLGYRLSASGARLKATAEAKIRQRIQLLIYNNLLREPQHGTQDWTRVSRVLDRDYLVALAQLRRYLYGELRERDVRMYAGGGAPLKRFKGVMSAYPMLDDTGDLRALDDWIVDQLWLAVQQRREHIPRRWKRLPPPYGLTRSELKRLQIRLPASTAEAERDRAQLRAASDPQHAREIAGALAAREVVLDLRPPSIQRISTLVRAVARQHGPGPAAFASAAQTW